RARTDAALVPATVEERRETDRRLAAADVERADALRRVDLVARDRDQIEVHRLDVDGDAAEALRRVGVEQDAAGARQPADRLERLEHAHLVCGRTHSERA